MDGVGTRVNRQLALRELLDGTKQIILIISLYLIELLIKINLSFFHLRPFDDIMITIVTG